MMTARYPANAPDCPVCGNPLPPPAATGRKRVWCSRKCRRMACGRTPDQVRAWRVEIDRLNSIMKEA
jgi:hypothetical protein